MSDVVNPIRPSLLASARPRLRIPWLMLARGAVGLVLVAVWEAGARSMPDLVASPAAALMRLSDLARSGTMLPMVGVTLAEAIGGLLLGAVPGMVLPFLIQLSPRATAAIEPLARAAVGIPKLALSPILILWFGIGLGAKVVLVGAMTFFLVFVATFAGIRSVGLGLVRTVAIFGAGGLAIAREVYWHSAQPFVWAALRAALPWAINAALVGEFLAAEDGVGHFIHHAYNLADVTGVYAGIILVAILVLAADWLLVAVQRRALRWRPVEAGTVLT